MSRFEIIWGYFSIYLIFTLGFLIGGWGLSLIPVLSEPYENI